MNEPMGSAQERREALLAGVSYLERVQLPGGDFPVYSAESADMTVDRKFLPNHFATALLVGLLHDCLPARALCERAADFIDRERNGGDLWRYWRSDYRQFPWVPVDTDDSSLASSALVAMGRETPDNRAVLLATRDRHGMFYTWILPWIRPLRLSMIPEMVRQVPLLLAFRRSFKLLPWISPGDVDAGVNANVLAWLGAFDGDHRVIATLLEILRDGREASCDRFYDDPVLVRFFFSRALVGRSPEAGELLVTRAEPDADAPPLDIALTILTRAIWKAPVPDAWVNRLMAAQAPDGSWPIAPLYCRGRKPLGYLNNAPTETMCWRRGGEASSTAFAVAALNAVAI